MRRAKRPRFSGGRAHDDTACRGLQTVVSPRDTWYDESSYRHAQDQSRLDP
jgi:hypothetical protein